MRPFRISICAATFSLLAALTQAEQTLESVESEVETLWTKISAFSAKVTTDTNVPMGPLTVSSHATGTLECLKKEDATLFRLDMVNKLDTGIPLAGPMEQKMLSVYDGKEIINEMEMMGRRQAFRMPPETAGKQGPSSGKSMFASFRDKGDVKLLPDSTVDGKPTWVIEVVPNEATKSSAPTPVGLMKFYISKEHGLQIKTEVFDDKGAPTSTSVYSEVDLNAKPAPERFVYTPPAGVTVQDMSALKNKLPGN
ncbi:MAG: hypothetical protein HUU46_14695 [Candidatus Hydrogenedentes bacterium]|nr:hypothetical protein [Candidatus Hydrogenedentota bacterium]